MLSLAAASAPHAQNRGDAEKKLERVRAELKSVAAQRRALEGQRGEASRRLRAADEQVGHSGRVLRQTEQALTREQQQLAQLRERRDALEATLASKRAELTRLVRAAYTIGGDAPLRALLSQDRAAEAQRMLAYHGYLQRDRARRIRVLTAELSQLRTLEEEIAQRQQALDASRRAQRAQLAELERARRERAGLVAQLDRQYEDRAGREKALGRDAKALQDLLARLRAAAAKAAAERAAAAKASRAAAAASKPSRSGSSATSRPLRRPDVSGPPLQVGGLSWPVSGGLLARYGGRLPDGRTSQGVLIAAAPGTTVRAVADGRVVFSDWMNGYGLILILDHGNGYMSLYAHNDALLRDAGDGVKRGDALASVGNSGGQGRPALYFELRRNGQPVNPDSWLQRR